MVEQVVRLEAQLHREPVREAEALVEAGVDVPGAGPPEGVALAHLGGVGVRPDLVVAGERAGDRANALGLVADVEVVPRVRHVRLRLHVVAVERGHHGHPGAVEVDAVRAVADRERRPALGGEQQRQLPAVEESLREARRVPRQRELPDGTADEAVAHVELGPAVVQVGVQRVEEAQAVGDAVVPAL